MYASKHIALALALGGAAFTTQAAHHEKPDTRAVAKGWIEASCGELDAFIDYAGEHMASDGVVHSARYVGLGFTMDGEDGGMAKVLMVVPGTPAAETLQSGDTFVSVNGVPAKWENRDKLTFRGAPGAAVSATILRDGEEMDVEIRRGIIERTMNKQVALDNLRAADADNWPSDSCTVQGIAT